MTDEQRDDLIAELSLYEPALLQGMVLEFIIQRDDVDNQQSIYDYLAEKIEIFGYWRKVGLA